MIGITAEEVAETFTIGWIARFGVPSIVTTDQGRQFESALFMSLLKSASIQRTRTTSYHPCANGMVERLHRQLKAALMCHGGSWSTALPLVLLGMRAALKEDLQTSCAELVYGEPLRLPGEFVTPTTTSNIEDVHNFATALRSHMAQLKPVPASRHSERHSFVFKELSNATHVFLRDDSAKTSLRPPYTGPHRVIARTDKTITIALPNRDAQVSLDRVKPAFIEQAPHSGFTGPTTPQSPSCQPPQGTPLTSPTVASKSDSNDPAPKSYVSRSGRHVRFKMPIDV